MSMSKSIYVHEELAHYAVYTFTLCFSFVIRFGLVPEMK